MEIYNFLIKDDEDLTNEKYFNLCRLLKTNHKIFQTNLKKSQKYLLWKYLYKSLKKV